MVRILEYDNMSGGKWFILYPHKSFSGDWHLTSLENFESMYRDLNKVTDIYAENAQEAVDTVAEYMHKGDTLEIVSDSSPDAENTAICVFYDNGKYNVKQGRL